MTADLQSLVRGSDVLVVAMKTPEGLSLHNTLAGTVSSVHAEPRSDHVIVQIAVGRVVPERLERCFGPGRFHRVERADDLPVVLGRVHEELTRT